MYCAINAYIPALGTLTSACAVADNANCPRLTRHRKNLSLGRSQVLPYRHKSHRLNPLIHSDYGRNMSFADQAIRHWHTRFAVDSSFMNGDGRHCWCRGERPWGFGWSAPAKPMRQSHSNTKMRVKGLLCTDHTGRWSDFHPKSPNFSTGIHQPS